MSVDPDKDDDVEITNGGFDADTGWTKNDNWSIAGGKAHYVKAVGAENYIFQWPGFRNHFRYRLTFTLSNYNIDIAVGKGFRVTLDGIVSGFYTANGTYTFETVAGDVSEYLGFFVTGASVGNSVVLDDVTLVKMENYVEENLDIYIREPKITSTYPAVATDYYSSLACRSDNSSCLISFDLP